MNRLMKIMLLLVLAAFCSLASAQEPDYADTCSWAYWRVGENKAADLFIVCPTVDLGTDGHTNMSLTDENIKGNFTGALNMQRGIYEKNCRMYAPYYRQATLADYTLPRQDAAAYFDLAYSDVRAAFLYYMHHENNGRPFVLSGFSQGAEMCLRLLKEFGNTDFVKNNMVACYAIGWRFTPQEAAEYPYIQPAKYAYDLGKVIIFNSEAPEVTSSLMVPHGEKSFCINPLNWRTGGTMADKALNSGACFTDYSGSIKREMPNLTGCYIDNERGTLKVTDVDKKEFVPGLSIFTDGIYHLYDYQFFYRNLQQNVGLRINTFVEERQVQNAA